MSLTLEIQGSSDRVGLSRDGIVEPDQSSTAAETGTAEKGISFTSGNAEM
jgi:hypothetical protein